MEELLIENIDKKFANKALTSILELFKINKIFQFHYDIS